MKTKNTIFIKNSRTNAILEESEEKFNQNKTGYIGESWYQMQGEELSAYLKDNGFKELKPANPEVRTKEKVSTQTNN